MYYFKSHKKISISVLLFFLFTIPLTLVVLKEQQDVRHRAAGEVWTEIGTHEQASNLNSTFAPKNFYTLMPWNNSIYAGYGDYQDNRGPIAISAFNPLARTFAIESIFDTDAVYRYRQVQGRFMAPSIDPIGAPIPLDIRLDDGTWIQPENLYTTHTYDVGTLDGSDLWVVGSSNYDAVAWRSTDSGISWQQSLKENAGPGLVNRFYHLAVLNNKLYVQNNQSSISKVFDGTSWTNGPNITSFGTLQTYFLGKALYLSSDNSGQVLVFNGTNVTRPVAGTFYSLIAYGNYLYALSTTDIKRTSDLVTWTPFITSLPTNTKRITITNGKLYAGANAKIFEYSSPISTLPNVRIHAITNAAFESGIQGLMQIERTGDTTQPLTVLYESLGTAKNGIDYANLSGSVTIPVGLSTIDIPIIPINDTSPEGFETIILRLKDTAAYNNDYPYEAMTTLYEKPTVTLFSSQKNIPENGQASFVLKRSGDISSALTVSLSFNGSTATSGTDYSPISNSVIMPAGTSSISIPFSGIDDNLEEGNETVKISLIKTANYTVILPFQAQIGIVDDDLSANPNILFNPSFEQLDGSGKPLSWSIGAASVDKTTAHSGQNSIKITGPTAFSYFNQPISPLPGKTYIISAWIKSQNAFGRGAGFRFVQTSATSTIQESPWLNGTNDWKHITLKVPVKPDFTAGRIDLWTALNAGEGVWFDDVRIAEEGASGTPLPTETLNPTITNSPTIATSPSPTACAVPNQTGLGKTTGNTPDTCEKITWIWTPSATATSYRVTLDGTTAFSGLGSLSNGKVYATVSATPGLHTDCLYSINACGESTPSCGTSNVGSCQMTTTITPLPTLLAEATNTPFPTFSPSSTVFSFTVFLHGIGLSGDNVNEEGHALSNKNPITTTRPLIVEVFESDPDTSASVKVLEKSGTITYQPETGNYTGVIDMGTTLQNKAYTVKLKGDKYFKKSGGNPTVIAGTTIQLPPTTLSAGDAFEDNNANINDYNLIYSCYSVDSPPRSCTAAQKYQADLNDDGNVNQYDYNLFLREISNLKGE